MFYAHQNDGITYIIRIEKGARVWPGAGTQRFDSVKLATAKWPRNEVRMAGDTDERVTLVSLSQGIRSV